MRPGGIPLIGWIGALVLGIGGVVWVRKRGSSSGSSSPSTAGKTGQPAFSQAQEVQDFQVFSALTSAQQGSDLNFLSEVASLLGGGSSTGTTSGTSTGASSGTSTGSGVSAPASTGTTSPATVPASTVASSSTPASSQPGYGAGLAQLQANNPNLAAAPGIAGYTVSYNGVPI